MSGALLAQLLWLRAEQGRLRELDETLAGMEAFADTYTVVLPMLAFARARLDDVDGARAALHTSAQDDFVKLGRDWSWPVSLAMLVEAATIIRDRAFNAALHRALVPYRGQLLVLSEGVLCVGAADRYLAMLDDAEGRSDAASAGYDAAYEIEARYPSPPLMTRTDYWRGCALAERPETATAARHALDDCLDTAHALGMRELARKRRPALTRAPRDSTRWPSSRRSGSLARRIERDAPRREPSPWPRGAEPSCRARARVHL
jgi:hypothetical protein